MQKTCIWLYEYVPRFCHFVIKSQKLKLFIARECNVDVHMQTKLVYLIMFETNAQYTHALILDLF